MFYEDVGEVYHPEVYYTSSSVRDANQLVVTNDTTKKTLIVNWEENSSIPSNPRGICSKSFKAQFCPTLSWQIGVTKTLPPNRSYSFVIYLYTVSKHNEFDFDISSIASVMDDESKVLTSLPMVLVNNFENMFFDANYGFRCQYFLPEDRRSREMNIKLRVVIKYKRRIEGFESLLERMDSYKQFIDNREYSDFTILLDEEKKIGVNKAAMLIQWPYFKLMIEANMVEAKSNIMVVSGIEYDVMKALVEFLSTGLTDYKNVEFALRLISAAHRYEVWGLIDNCIEFISERLTTAYVLDALVLADSLELDELTDVCLEFVCVEKRSKGKLNLKCWPGYGKFVTFKNHYEIVLKIVEKV